ncbi:MAG TPA: hypothetical protein VFF73_04060 [Planctomycetota bacterium]|nr:hypothetical protein [Planctomycetota bacterium]
MNAMISGRQHLVPGLLDLSEDEIAPSGSRFDLLTFATAVAVALGLLALFVVLR